MSRWSPLSSKGAVKLCAIRVAITDYGQKLLPLGGPSTETSKARGSVGREGWGGKTGGEECSRGNQGVPLDDLTDGVSGKRRY